MQQESLTQRCDNHVEILCSYPQHFVGIIDVVHIRVVVVQMWTELVEASAKVAILQMDQQRSAKKHWLDIIKYKNTILGLNDVSF